MRAMLVILGKDLRQRLRDRSAIETAIVVPLVLASIFGLIFHNAIGGKVTFKLGVVDLDRGPAAVAFSRSALGPLERQGLIDVRPQGSLAAGRDAADRDQVAATFVIPAGFSTALATGRPASLRVLGSVDSPIGTRVAQAIAGAFGDAISTGRIAAAAGAGAGASGASALGLAPAAPPRIRPREFSPAPKAPIAVADISTRSRQLDAGTFYAAGMAVFFLFFTVQFGISRIHDERRDGTLARMLAAPIRPQAVLGGKLLTSLTLGALSFTVLALATHLLLSAHVLPGSAGRRGAGHAQPAHPAGLDVFFLFVLPMLIILLLGAAFGGGNRAKLGVVGGGGGPLAAQFVAALRARPSMEVHTYSSVSKMQSDVAHGVTVGGIVIPASYDGALARGSTVTLGYLSRADGNGQQVRTTVQAVAADQARTLAAAQKIARVNGQPFRTALVRARAAVAGVAPVSVRLTAPNGGAYTFATGRFNQGASTQLLLFIFLNSLSGAVWVIETRRLGVARRILSTPTSARALVGGQLLGRLAIALLQALIIVLGSALLFGVSWGDPLGTAAVILAFALVATGVAVLLATLFDTEQQAGPVALLLGLGLAALGGSMAPLEVFPDTARKIAHITPHAWANDAFSKLLKHGGDLVSVLPQLGVLLAFAAAAITVAVWRLQRTLRAA